MSEDWSRRVRRDLSRVSVYIVLLAVLLFIAGFSFETIPLLGPYSNYLVYIQGILIALLGYKILGAVSQAVYHSVRKFSDHPTAASMRTIARIGGIAVLLSVLSSLFKVNPTAALTIGSFSGLVVGFATQNVLTQAVSGIFLAISRPFQVGDEVTVLKYTGVVKDIRVMQTVLRTPDGKEVLIPNNKIVGEVIVINQREEGSSEDL